MDKQLWHRRPDETQKSFGAFTLYLNMLPKARSLEKVREELGKNTAYIRVLEKWSPKYQWVSRTAAYDEHRAAVQREANEEGIREMAKRQAVTGETLQKVGLKSFVDEKGEIKKGTLEDKVAIQAIKVGTDIERTARGEPTEIVDHKVKEVKELSDEDLHKIVLAAKEAGEIGGLT